MNETRIHRDHFLRGGVLVDKFVTVIRDEPPFVLPELEPDFIGLDTTAGGVLDALTVTSMGFGFF